jgi:hypothetical protein
LVRQLDTAYAVMAAATFDVSVLTATPGLYDRLPGGGQIIAF